MKTFVPKVRQAYLRTHILAVLDANKPRYLSATQVKELVDVRVSCEAWVDEAQQDGLLTKSKKAKQVHNDQRPTPSNIQQELSYLGCRHLLDVMLRSSGKKRELVWGLTYRGYLMAQEYLNPPAIDPGDWRW